MIKEDGIFYFMGEIIMFRVFDSLVEVLSVEGYELKNEVLLMFVVELGVDIFVLVCYLVVNLCFEKGYL